MIRSRIKKLSSILQRRSGRQTVRRAIRINNLKPSIEQLESRVLLAIDLRIQSNNSTEIICLRLSSFQLAYCDTIIQRNSRINLPVVGNLSSAGGSAPSSAETAKPILLDSFFPFDPYRLAKSKKFIEVSSQVFF